MRYAEQRRRLQEPGATSEERHLDAVAADMPIDQQGDDAIVTERLADLQRGVERLPHFQRLDTHGRARLVAQPLHLGIRFRHRDDRERQLQDAAHQDAADLPIAEMSGDQQRAAPFAKDTLEDRRALRLEIEQALRLARRCRQRAQEIDRVGGVASVGVEGTTLERTRDSSGNSGCRFAATAAVVSRISRHASQVPTWPIAYETRRGSTRTPRTVSPNTAPLLSACRDHQPRTGSAPAAAGGVLSGRLNHSRSM